MKVKTVIYKFLIALLRNIAHIFTYSMTIFGARSKFV